ncbi:hypothetical protein V1264_000037 [Littorina saxatilis]|uniref:Uncharacterized protein n=1 Tax=Littorina saxatilis TaxID=31220 RepID=A0AAN9BWB4_9CAEN
MYLSPVHDCKWDWSRVLRTWFVRSGTKAHIPAKPHATPGRGTKHRERFSHL